MFKIHIEDKIMEKQLVDLIITPHVQHKWGKVINVGVHTPKTEGEARGLWHLLRQLNPKESSYNLLYLLETSNWPTNKLWPCFGLSSGRRDYIT